MEIFKFGILKNGNPVEFKYKNEYTAEKIDEVIRFIVTSNDNYIDLMLDLIKDEDDCDYSILYILVVPRCDNKEGRYEIEKSIKWTELKAFCDKYKNFLQKDGRHNFWIVNHNTGDLIVYDRHNVLYVYENLIYKMKILEDHGYKNVKKIFFPHPHSHHYNEENDKFENDLIKTNKWIFSPLQEGDEE